MSSVTRSSYRDSLGGKYESETARLQHEVDTFTQKLESEKRRLLIIEEQIKQVNSELSEKKDSLGKIELKPQQAQAKKIQIKSKKCAVNNERLKLNDTKTKNKNLRKDIDCLRKELTSAQNECKRLDRNTSKVRKQAELMYNECVQNKKNIRKLTNKTIAGRASAQEQQKNCEQTIEEMLVNLAKQDPVQEFDDKEFEKNCEQLRDKNNSSDFSSNVSILKLRLSKIIATNKEKKRLMDQYFRNVKVIEDAFEQIKEATGITSIEEIVTSFVKAEEQNYTLYNFVNSLSTETDQLEESNKEIKAQIERIIERGKLTEQEKEDMRRQMEQECEQLESDIKTNNNEAETTKRMFKKIQQHVEIMVDMFKRSKFFLSVAQKQNYDEGFVFTENNIVQYLAELEEYICSLITYTAFKRDDPNAPISSIPLEKLNQKEFARKILQIEPPSLQTDFKPLDTNGMEATVVEEDFQITNSKALYSNFQRIFTNEKNGALSGKDQANGQADFHTQQRQDEN